ncbi:MAG: aminopeptidase [Sedimentisphaerales bacterium]|nr:aminopeptidase [Sedimentisphaerales bacterium]
MTDPRLKKLAQVIVNYSVSLKKGEIVLIKSPSVAEPLVKELYTAAIQAGAHPHVHLIPDDLTEILLKHGSNKQLEYLSPILMHDVETIHAQIGLWAETNTKALSNTDAAKHAKLSAARQPYMERFMERTAKNQLRWNGTLFPTNASAQDAGMSLTEYEDFVFNAGRLNEDDPVSIWKGIEKKQNEAVKILNGKKNVHLQANNGTDLEFSIEGRKWINCCGTHNFPDGEIFTCPIEDSVNGSINFSFPACHMGHQCKNVKLVFENGKVIKASAESGEEFLLKMIDQDPGARFVGEFAIGTNYNIQQFTCNTLFDEKIGGTVHLALGASLPEAGGVNKSGLHWDMVCDLRDGGSISVDDKIIHQNGKFIDVEL